MFIRVILPPAWVNRRPFKLAPLFIALVIPPGPAKILPTNEVVVSRVAPVAIRHHTLHGSPPVTDEPGDVIRVVAVLKIQTPEPVRAKVPVRVKLLVEQ